MEVDKTQIKKEINTILERVVYLMKKYPECRNSDRLLYFVYLREFYHWFTDDWLDDVKGFSYFDWREMWLSLPLFASVTRLRAKAQNELGECLAESEIEIVRVKRENYLRELLKNDNQAKIGMFGEV